jgi:twinkle protein
MISADDLQRYAALGIELSAAAAGPEVLTTCPRCRADRKKSTAKCLSVNIVKRCWCCHHCGWADGLRDAKDWRPPPGGHTKTYRRPDPRPQGPLPEHVLDWFHARGITDEVLIRNRVDYGRVFMPELQAEVEAVIFPYLRAGELVNRKYRALAQKAFCIDPGCELVLYGLGDIEPARLIWVEGELDKLALEVAGYRSAVSVPNGAPAVGTKNYDALLRYLDADHDRLEAVQRHVLALDMDGPGHALEAELARRLGPERCARVRWPDGCKDANELLVKHGVEELQWYLEHATPYPIEGAVGIEDCREEVLRLYEQGFERGHSTGWSTLDRLYTVRPGELTVVTGIPSSGKSNWLDCLLVNLARLHGWSFGIFSPENLPLEQHMAAMAEKYLGLPFHDGRTPRMSRTELDAALAWAAEHFTWIMPSSEDDWTIERILEIGRQLCFRAGIRGLVIDPWNELESLKPSTMTETEYVSHVLKRVRVFARTRGVHVWIVVHPAKLYRTDGKYPVPTLYDCSGSANWRNKADNGLVVWRDLATDDRNEVQLHVQKIRFRHVGKRGMCPLYYNPVCATYDDQRVGGDGAARGRERFAL